MLSPKNPIQTSPLAGRATPDQSSRCPSVTMPRNSNSKGNAKATKPHQRHSQKLQPASNTKDVNELHKYLTRVLNTATDKIDQQGHSPQKPQQDILQSGEHLSCYLQEAVNEAIHELSTTEKVTTLLNVAHSCEPLAIKFKDNLVVEVRDELFSLAHGTVAAILLQEARQAPKDSVPSSTCDAAAILLSCLSDDDIRSHNTWAAITAIYLPKDTVCILRHLLRTGIEQFAKSGTINTNTPSQYSFHPGLPLLLFSKHSANSMALLLRDEVERSRDKSGSFLTTELAHLFSFTAIFQRDLVKDTLEVKGFMERLLKKIAPLPTDMAEVESVCSIIQYGCMEMRLALAAALSNVLKSNVAFNQNSVLLWLTTALNFCDQNAIGGRHEHISDAFMLNFSSVLFRVWTLSREKQADDPSNSHQNIPRNSKEPGEITMNQSKQMDGETSTSSVSGAQFMEQLSICCQRALRVCLLPVIRRYCLLSNASSLHRLRSSGLLETQVQLLWQLDTNLICMCYKIPIFEFYSVHLKAQTELLELHTAAAAGLSPHQLDNTGDEGNEQVDTEALFEDMTDWIYYLSFVSEIFEDGKVEIAHIKVIIDSIVKLMQNIHSSPEFHPDKILRLIRALGISTILYRNQASSIQRVTCHSEHLFPFLLCSYNFVTKLKKLMIDDQLLALTNRASIAWFFNESWDCEEFKKTLSTKSQTNLFEEFLIALVCESQHLVAGVCNSFQVLEYKTSAEQPFLLKWLQQHVQLLYKLTSNDLFSPLFLRFRTFPHVMSTVCYIIRFLSKQTPQSSDKLVGLWKRDHKTLTARLLETLLALVKRKFNEENRFVTLFQPEDLNAIETDPFFQTKQFSILRNTVNEVKNIHLQIRETQQQGDETWVTKYLETSMDEDDLLDTLRNQLQPARLGTATLFQSHALRDLVKDTCQETDKQEALAKEFQRIERTLPFHLSSLTFLVRHEDRADVLRCLMSGPVGTPFSRGLFVVDIYCPDDYPSFPPMVKFVYSVDGSLLCKTDGKRNHIDLTALEATLDYKCNKAKKWSILRVLHCIAKEMLSFRSKKVEDISTSSEEIRRQLWEVRAVTIRHAMLDPLLCPPPGLEKVVRIYFETQRPALLKQCARWFKDCSNDDTIKTDIRILCRELKNPERYGGNTHPS